ncbi:MAG: hypothetical protein EXS36_18010 [Pedosphaera sp.]|nr:hypothetical protein [Pedosphaera sp.]
MNLHRCNRRPSGSALPAVLQKAFGFTTKTGLRFGVIGLLGVALLSLPLCIPLAAAPPPIDSGPVYHVRRWTNDDGLPQQDIGNLLIAHDGYVWVGSGFGLAKTDGRGFRVFNGSPLLPGREDVVTSLAEDSKNRLWVGFNHGLLRITGTNVTAYRVADGLPANRIRVLCPDTSGGVWVGTSAGVSWIGPDSARPIRSWTATNGLIAGQIQQIIPGPDGHAFLSTENGWQEILTENSAPQRPSIELTPGNAPGTAVFGKNGLVAWAGTTRGVFERTEEGWRKRWTSPTENKYEILQLYQTGQGAIWLVSRSEGLLRWNGSRFIAPRVAGDVSLKTVHHVASEQNGIVWAVGRQGLFRLKAQRVKNHTRSSDPGQNDFWSVAADIDGSVWVASLDDISVVRNSVMSPLLPLRETSHRSPILLLPDNRGGLWLADSLNGLVHAPDGKSPRTARPILRPSSAPKCLYRESSGDLWMGTTRGLFHFDQDTAVAVAGGPPSAVFDVRCILRSVDGSLWIGTAGRGLWRQRDDTWTQIGDTEVFRNGRIYALHESPSGVVWAGTQNGLVRWETNRLSLLTLKNGLEENVINQILEDGQGRLWLGGLRGIHGYRRQDLDHATAGQFRLEHITLGLADGMGSAETNGELQPAGCRSQDGHLWFPTTYGLAEFDPQQMSFEPGSVSAEIDCVLIDQETRGEERLRHGAGGEEIVLGRGAAHIVEVHYSAAEFDHPDQLRFEYRLTGLNSTWRDAGNHRVALFTDLKPGRYRFEVRVANSEGRLQAEIAHVDIVLKPYLWQRLSLRLASGCLAAACLAIALRKTWNRNQLQLISQRQGLEIERTRIARDLHDDVGANLTGLALRAELASRRLPPEAARELGSFARDARNLVDHMREVIWAVNPTCDTLESLVSYIVDHAEVFLERAGVSCRLDVPDHLPSAAVHAEARHQLLMVVKEALTNAVRHSEAQIVQLRVRYERKRLTVTIEDNGRGFEPVDSPGFRISPTGLGLENMQRRLRAVGGSVRISSELGGGTTVDASLPIEEDIPPNVSLMNDLKTAEAANTRQAQGLLNERAVTIVSEPVATAPDSRTNNHPTHT